MSNGFFNDSVQFIKGIGPRRAGIFQKAGITSIEDAFYYLPYRYEDRSSLQTISSLREGTLSTVRGSVAVTELIRTRRKKFQIFELTLTDGTGLVKAKWFNQPFLKKVFKKGQLLFLSGIVKTKRYHGVGYEMENPEYEIIDDGKDSQLHTSRIVPVYRTPAGIGQKTMRTIMYNVVTCSAKKVSEFLPEYILDRNNLIHYREALLNVHFPEKEGTDVSSLNEGTSPFHRRLVFDELFLFQLGITRMKKGLSEEKGMAFTAVPDLTNRLIQSLPFALTNAQKKVLREIFDDMETARPMNRLIQGDVGSGKTVVALAAMLKAVENGFQTSMMVPTELLAQQHYFNIRDLLGDMNVRCSLLTSKEKENIKDADIVIGTHALIQESVMFEKLGLAVIDEQHRFGVRQRARLRKKGFNPDILVMTATPIPRTLAMTVYGDLDHSSIGELPPGRTPVETIVVLDSEKKRVYDLLHREITGGGQAYIVYPVIEEGNTINLKSAEEGFEAFKGVFPGYRIELIHGRMKPDERQRIMKSFKDGKIDILVSTTVIEVGVDVPNANVMVIVHSERFGLSQLHQLRGRVGRGRRKSYCVLLSYGKVGEDAEKRLHAMEVTTDGFKIAEEDLKIRGPGDFFGTAQSGMPALRVANIVRDSKILGTAKKEAVMLLDKDPLLNGYPILRDRVNAMWKGKMELYKTV